MKITDYPLATSFAANDVLIAVVNPLATPNTVQLTKAVMLETLDVPVNVTANLAIASGSLTINTSATFSNTATLTINCETSANSLLVSGNATFNNTVKLSNGYTVASLPAAGVAGRRAFVTDAASPTFLGTLTGGGSTVCPVFDNGVAWIAG